MKKALSGCLTILLAIIMVVPFDIQVSAYLEKNTDNTFTDIQTNQRITDIKKIPKNIKSVNTKIKNGDTEQISNIIELAENGVDIFVECDSSDEVEKYFGFSFKNSLYENNGIMLGFVVENSTYGVRGVPVYACCMYDETEIPTISNIKSDCSNIKKDFTITQDDIDIITEKSTEFKSDNNINDTVKLQAINIDELPENTMFFDDQYFMFAYGKTINGETEWDEASAVDGYVKLGYAKIRMKCYNIGNKLNRNYDTALVISEVGAYNNYSVKEYKTGIVVSENSVVNTGYCPEDTSNRNVTVSLGVGVSSSGDITNTTTYTESCSPNGQEFDFSYLDEFTYQVSATPMSTQKGASWESISGMSAAVPSGTQGMFVSGIMSLTISRWRTYKLEDCEAGVVCIYQSHESLY